MLHFRKKKLQNNQPSNVFSPTQKAKIINQIQSTWKNKEAGIPLPLKINEKDKKKYGKLVTTLNQISTYFTPNVS